jgi:tetratricopeptide (TPR) repeat protein
MYYQEAGRISEAIVLMYQVLERHPGYDKALFKLVTLLERADRWEEMTPVAREGVEYYPDQAVYHFYLGESLIREGKTEEGLEVFERCLALKPPTGVREHIGRAFETYRNNPADAPTPDGSD